VSENHEPIPAQTAFFVVVDLQGMVSVHTTEIPSVTLAREATLYDIETYGQQLVRNIGRVIAAQMTISALAPAPEPTAAERVAEALQKREED
jgi:hypothetical protein